MLNLRPLTRFAARLRAGIAPPPALPRADRRRSAARALAAGAVSVAILHLGLALAAEQSRYLRDPVYADKARKLSRLEQSLPADTPLVVFLGTSRSANGFDAGRAQAALTDSLGRPVGAFNWGVPATGPVTHLLHLKRMLADGHTPALLLLEVHSPTLAGLPDGPLEGRFADGTAFAWDEFGLVAQYGFPVDKLRDQRRRVAVAPWYALRFQLLGRLAPTALPFHCRHDSARGPDPNGWGPVLVETVTDDVRAAGAARAKLEYTHIFKGMRIGEAPTRALRDLLELCRDRAIPVVLVRMPEGKSFQKLYPTAVAAQVDNVLSKLAATTGCTLADCRDWMPAPAFIDGHHLLRAPAGVFSERLARDVIAPALRNANGGGRQ